MSSHKRSAKVLKEFDIGLLYIEGLPSEYFDDFRDSIDFDAIDFREEQRENEPFAALEWMIPTVVALYIGKKFADALLKKATDDFADSVYPKLKQGVTNLAKKLLVQDRSRFCVLSGGEKKVTNAASTIFSVTAQTTGKHRAKFVFHDDGLSELEYEIAVDKIFSTLESHYHDDDCNLLSDTSPDLLRGGSLFLIFDKQEQTWNLVDPIAERLKQQAERDAKG